MVILENTDIYFPGLGITFKNIGNGIEIFGFKIAFYGMVIAFGMVMGYLISAYQAKRTNQDPEDYLSFAIVAIIVSVICARIYYVVFKWENFSDDFWSVFNLRTGGLAIYGGIIGGVSTAFIYCRIMKRNTLYFFDTACVGLVTGQIIGRWGNFFNREAFGSYTNGFTRMLVNVKDTFSYFDPSSSEAVLRNDYAGKSEALERILEIRNNAVLIDGETYVSVHPTFFYESFLNLLVLIFILWYTKRKKAHGELFFIYLGGYGLIRFFVEGLRSDQLFLWGTGIAVSQMLGIIMFVVSAAAIIYLRIKKPLSAEEKEKINQKFVKTEDNSTV